MCSGTLIAPTVFLTAAHCIAALEAEGITELWVTFTPDYDEGAGSPAGITPARLPAAGLLDRLEAGHQLRATTFTAVGYGAVREDKTGGPESSLIVSITITGDAMCRATDKIYRLDTAAAREFLARFVTLP